MAMNLRMCSSAFCRPIWLGFSGKCYGLKICRQRRGALRAMCTGGDMEKKLFGEDFGARDPTPGEITSDFGTNVLGNADTLHQIKPPDKMGTILGLKAKKCVPCEGGVSALGSKEIDRLRNQVPGWKVVKDENGKDRIRIEWKVKNFLSGLECFKRIAMIAEEEGHHPDLHLEGWNRVAVELWTHSVGGLTENDFIMAAKINDINMSDLKRKPKSKMWA